MTSRVSESILCRIEEEEFDTVAIALDGLLRF